jgi:hypothetical protein
VLAALLIPLTACNIVSLISYYFSPPQIQPAEFKLTDGRLAVLIEVAHAEQDNPIFAQALCERLAEVFRDHGVRSQLVPQEEIYRLRQQNRDFLKWSVQKVGRCLNAKQVLYARVEELRLRESPDVPVLQPLVQMRLRVVDPAAPADKAQLWPGPQERQGRAVSRARPERLAEDAIAIDEEAAKLGKDAAYLVAGPFYDVDLEKKTPWEP